ncbi:MAG: GNAT family N-acetyltransferase [Gammaproteobacteria bacterium]|jgi:ribosomal protein S18 acetylase RimI-like enzyme
MAIPDNIHFRPAVKADIPALCSLLEQLFTLEADFQPDAEKQARALARLISHSEAGASPGCLVWLALDGQEVVGMCTVQVYISTAEGGDVGLVEDVIVSADYRQHGIGREMLRGLENWARQQGLSRLQLLADKHNQRALAFYQRTGWCHTQLICQRKTISV